MSDHLDWPDYLLTGFLFAVYTFVGVFYGFKSSFVKCWHRICHRKSEETGPKDNDLGADEIFLANRKLTLFPIVCSTLASFMSAVALTGNNSEFYLFGLEFLNLILGYIISFPIAAEVFAPVFYKLNLASGHEVLILLIPTLFSTWSCGFAAFYVGLLHWSFASKWYANETYCMDCAIE